MTTSQLRQRPVHLPSTLEVLETWPVRLHLLDAHGVTLWSGGDTDLLLAGDNRILLFATSWELRHFVLSGARCNLERRPSYVKLRDYLKRGSDKRLRIEDRDYSLDRVLRWLSKERMSDATQLEILDTLNLLWDAANTVGNNRTLRVLRTTRFRRFLDSLTFARAEESTVRADVDWQALARDVAEAMQSLRPAIEVLPSREADFAVVG